MLEITAGILGWLAVIAGHLGIWCAIFNRTHATAWPRKWRKIIEKGVVIVVLIPLLGYPVWIGTSRSLAPSLLWQKFPLAAGYAYISAVAAIYFLTTWLHRLATYRVPNAVQLVRREYLKAEEHVPIPLTHGAFAKALARIPGNQATHLSVESRTLTLPRFRGTRPIRICQLSDFHFTGQIDIAYFEWVIRRVNAWKPDLVFLTGDLVDESSCLDWIQTVFGSLESGHGNYYLLGNHDRRIPSETQLRELCSSAGLIQASGQWHHLDVAGQKLLITGNELPWYPAAAHLPDAPADDDALRILLTHSPDQIDWARPHGFDLIFAGHTHGGQIRLPLFGPIISPSKYGVRFAGGTFQIEQAVMHVSRGLAGDEPIRLRCPPEVSFFVLQSPS